MIIKTAKFVISNTDFKKCPPATIPEYAFIGRSNVGKSSLINMLTNHKKLAKISSTPGKTQLINHFMINDNWYLVDLPGYGYAKVAKTKRAKWEQFLQDYILKRKNLVCTFVLVDGRHAPMKIDLEFMEWMGNNGVPFIMVFTKADKLSSSQLSKNLLLFKKEMSKTWEEIPKSVITSAETKKGKEEILNFIEETNKMVKIENVH